MTNYRENPRDFSDFDNLAWQLQGSFARLCAKQHELARHSLSIEFHTSGNQNEIKHYYYTLTAMGPMSNWITKIDIISTIYFWLYFKLNSENQIHYTLSTDLGLEQFKKCADRMSNCIEQIENEKYLYSNYVLHVIEDRYTKPIFHHNRNYYMQHYFQHHGLSRPHFSQIQNIPAVPKNAFLEV